MGWVSEVRRRTVQSKVAHKFQLQVPAKFLGYPTFQPSRVCKGVMGVAFVQRPNDRPLHRAVVSIKLDDLWGRLTGRPVRVVLNNAGCAVIVIATRVAPQDLCRRSPGMHTRLGVVCGI